MPARSGERLFYMRGFVYRCPATALRVQGFVAEDTSGDDGNSFEPITCIACSHVHLVNPETGKLLGEESED